MANRQIHTRTSGQRVVGDVVLNGRVNTGDRVTLGPNEVCVNIHLSRDPELTRRATERLRSSTARDCRFPLHAPRGYGGRRARATFARAAGAGKTAPSQGASGAQR